MSESDRPQAIDPCELHAQESQRLQPDRLTLTDAERKAIADAIEAGEFDANLFDCQWAREHAATLRGLLERTR